MSNIKTKDSKLKSVKILDKAVAWTERVKDPIVYANEKSKDAIDTESNINDYSDDKRKYVFNRIKDEAMYTGKKASHQTVEYAKKKYQKHKLIKAKDMNNTVHNSNKVIKTSKNVIKNAEKTTKEAAKISKKMAEQGKKLAIEGSKKAVQGTKLAIKTTVSAIKGIIEGVKSLVSMLAAGGSLAVIAIIIICLIGLLVGSIFGIFFSSEDTGKNNIKMSDCIVELNKEMDSRIKQIQDKTPHDEVIITSNKAEWKDMLSIYAVRISNGDNKQEVMSIDDNKKAILRQIFWDMNSLSNNVITEIYNKDNFIDYLDSRKENTEKRVLHIRINSKKVTEMSLQYNFNKNQINQLTELTNGRNQSLWNYAIYGNYSSNEKPENWKQYGKSWSSIRLGNSNHTIKTAGCLVTSIAILIKKSGVSTNSISPFNPGTFVTALNNIYGFDSYGCLKYAPISNLVPHFKYVGRVNLNGKSKMNKLNEIKKYHSYGYYLAIKVIDTNYAQHWVALDEFKGDTILMSDPGSKSTNLWQEYDWNDTTQFVYFKVEK